MNTAQSLRLTQARLEREQLTVAQAQLQILRTALQDLAERGTRADLTAQPNLACSGTAEGRAHLEYWRTYLQRLDEAVRKQARMALLRSRELTVRSDT